MTTYYGFVPKLSVLDPESPETYEGMSAAAMSAQAAVDRNHQAARAVHDARRRMLAALMPERHLSTFERLKHTWATEHGLKDRLTLILLELHEGLALTRDYNRKLARLAGLRNPSRKSPQPTKDDTFWTKHVHKSVYGGRYDLADIKSDIHDAARETDEAWLAAGKPAGAVHLIFDVLPALFESVRAEAYRSGWDQAVKSVDPVEMESLTAEREARRAEKGAAVALAAARRFDTVRLLATRVSPFVFPWSKDGAPQDAYWITITEDDAVQDYIGPDGRLCKTIRIGGKNDVPWGPCSIAFSAPASRARQGQPE